LKQLRKIDDNIVYALNNTIPTPSFAHGDPNVPKVRCQELHQVLKSSYEDRDKLIKNCIRHTSDRVQRLTAESGASDASLSKKLRSEQTQLRLLRKELNIEEVIQDRSSKIFHEKCRPFYRST